MRTRFYPFAALLAATLFLGCRKEPEPTTDPVTDPVVDPVIIPETKYFSGGSGTAEDPYLISTPADLKALSDTSNMATDAARYAAAYFKQGADIDMSATDFTPLFQKGNTKFSGTYDGDGKTISGLKILSSEKKASGFVAYANGATIKGINLSGVNMDVQYVYSGAIAGYVEGGASIENCSVSGQVRQYTASLNVLGEANEGYSGGVAGYVTDSRVADCTMNGNVTIYGKYSGGMFGLVENSTIENCKLLKENTVNIFYHWNGGLIGKARGASTVIRGCSFEGNLTAVGYVQGGIVGQMEGGLIENCVMGSYASIGCDKYFVGGIVGAILPVAECTVRNCAAYGTIKGQYSIGGIAGYTGFGNSTIKNAAATQPVTIENCACIGSEITATGNNGGSNSYSIAAGILGWSHGSNKLTVKDCYSAPAFIQTISAGNRGALAGIVAYQNSSSGNVLFKNCYSTVTPSSMFSCNEQITSVTTDNFHGGIYCRSTQATTFESCYCDSAIQLGTGDSAATEKNNERLSTASFTDGTLLSKLQASADGATWIAGANGLPTLQGLPADPNVKPKAKKRVSVIGDSISTFKGWVPAGYSTHYPATDGSLTLVNETYWYRLIYNHMKSATLDMNIAFSGSTVTKTTAENYAARYGSASNAWYGKDFVTRFIECGGCGRPDIILIHGGTNDWAHNADPLYPGSPLSKSATTPSDAVLNSIYAVADAAKTRTEVNALPDGSFCEAYVKLLCQIRERYPSCKVVCIIGDYLSTAFEESMLKMAEHYGAKTVDLLAVNGFNDQKYMPKHDFNGTSGCHPGSQAMAFIAEKIYTELGAWLEE